MEVREVGDAQPIQLDRNADELDVEDTLPQPAGLEPTPGGNRRGSDGERDEEPGQTESFSVTGATETTWRLNFSSELSSPAATPTS
jgi:hypothetical protein